MREFKFRAFVDGRMGAPFDAFAPEFMSTGGTFSDGVIIMQYTGLKDKNGKEIYEGDVIHIEYGECVGHEQVYEDYREIWEPITGSVVFEDGAFSFEGHSAGTLPLSAYIDDIVVVGNIYENPELIQKA